MDKPRRLRISRPQTARAVARRAVTLEDFGMNMRDWFHALRFISSRAQLARAVAVRPPRLAGKFEQGEIADAFLAAQVEYLCNRAGVRPPSWTRDSSYVLEEPWFSVPFPAVRAHLLLDTPTEFRNRNLFTTPEFEVKIRPGRPRVSATIQREKNRLRQQRFRRRHTKPVAK